MAILESKFSGGINTPFTQFYDYFMQGFKMICRPMKTFCLFLWRADITLSEIDFQLMQFTVIDEINYILFRFNVVF